MISFGFVRTIKSVKQVMHSLFSKILFKETTRTSEDQNSVWSVHQNDHNIVLPNRKLEKKSEGEGNDWTLYVTGT